MKIKCTSIPGYQIKPLTILLILFTSFSVLLMNCSRIEDASINQDANLIKFDGQRAFEDVIYQVSLGPRTPGSQGHDEIINWLETKLDSNGWESIIQETQYKSFPIRNVIGKYGQGKPWIILGAHFDTRIYADRDPVSENRNLPVPGGNDGASGVAVLLELARVLPQLLTEAQQPRAAEIWLVFFDAEDNGGINGREWIMGSQAFVNELTTYPDNVVVVDMVGDKNLNVYPLENSTPELNNEIWDTAKSLGYENYLKPDYRSPILDDHVPFFNAGIPAIDLIDLEYDYWHTIEDTPDKVSPKSLEIIGTTLLTWILNTGN